MEDEIQAGEDGLYCVGFKNVYALNRAQIYEAFSQYGSVNSVRGSIDGTESHRWAFVRFGNPEEAVRAITGMRTSPHLCNVNYVKYVQDNRRKGHGGGQSSSSVPVAGTGAAPAAGTGVSPLVRRDQPADRSPVRPPAERASRSSSGQFEVFVGNWPATLGEDDLYGLFDKFDIKVLSVRLYKKEQRSYAFVVVPTAEDVARAVEQLNRGKVAGQQIVVKDSRNSFTKQQSPAPQKQQPQPPQQQQQEQRQQPHHHHPQQQRQQQQQQPAPVSVRQRLGVPDRRAGGVAAPGSHGRADISQMPPLVLPPSEQRSAPPPPLSAPYRPPGGFSRGHGASEHYNANGVPAGQYNGRQAREEVRFEREPAPVHFERQPAPVDFGGDAAVEFEPAGGTFCGGAAGSRMRLDPGLPHLAGLGARRSFSQRTGAEADFSEPHVKRPRFGGPELGGPGLGPSGPLPLVGMGGPPTQSVSLSPRRITHMGPPPVALRSAVAISERIKSRLHAPMDVVVANFPAGTNEHALMQLFDRFEPLNVRIMVNNSSQHPDDFTYAYVTLSSRMMADEAVMEMDGVAFQGRPLVVETRKN